MARNQDGRRGMLNFEPKFDPRPVDLPVYADRIQWRPTLGPKMGTRGLVCVPPIEKIRATAPRAFHSDARKTPQ